MRTKLKIVLALLAMAVAVTVSSCSGGSSNSGSGNEQEQGEGNSDSGSGSDGDQSPDSQTEPTPQPGPTEPTPQPTGFIAVSPIITITDNESASTFDWAFVTGATAAEARSNAAAQCETRSNIAADSPGLCDFLTSNEIAACAAVATGFDVEDSLSTFSIRSGDTRSEAESRALEECEEEYTNCRLETSPTRVPPSMCAN